MFNHPPQFGVGPPGPRVPLRQEMPAEEIYQRLRYYEVTEESIQILYTLQLIDATLLTDATQEVLAPYIGPADAIRVKRAFQGFGWKFVTVFDPPQKP